MGPEQGQGTTQALTDFEHILLGLVALRPQSGYELKRLLTTTPASVYEPSSGTLYPALRRLERRGLLAAETAPSAGRRTKRSYRVTAAGRRRHEEWLRRPVEPTTVGRDLGTHLMRFVLAEPVLSTAEVMVWLRGLAGALEDFVSGVEAYLATTPPPGRHPSLALRHGIAVHRASLEWVRETLEALGAEGLAAGRVGQDPSASGRAPTESCRPGAKRDLGPGAKPDLGPGAKR